MVYVQNIEGKPLMPTTRYGKVRRMLKHGLASVIQRDPFIIRLNYVTTEITQPINLGIDAGSVHVGVSATTETNELYAAEVQLRTDVVNLISIRHEARKSRRGRKTRYRKSRFDNRKRKKDWLPPSIENRIQTHLRAIEYACMSVPVSVITIEVAQFDIQALKNPDTDSELYQKGEQFGFWNVREYVLSRDNHTCQYCKGRSKDKILNVHHIESRKTGGDSPGNLITLCKTCHEQYHQGKFELNNKRSTSFRDASNVGIMKWELYKRIKQKYPNVRMTFGYFTKYRRINAGLQKSHITDARCISGNHLALPLNSYFYMKQVRRHNRKIHKSKIIKGGRRKLNQAPYEIFGFRLFDKVLYQDKVCFVFGRRSAGNFDLRTLDGVKLNEHANKKYVKLIYHSKRLLVERRYCNIQQRERL